MQWSDVIKPPSKKVLRQFAGLWIVFFVGLGAWRWLGGKPDSLATALMAIGGVIGVVGLLAPAVMRPIFTGWMIAAFPIGWTVSRIVLGAVFFLVITPTAAVFRLTGRDLLRRQRGSRPSYWMDRPQTRQTADYLRQF